MGIFNKKKKEDVPVKTEDALPENKENDADKAIILATIRNTQEYKLFESVMLGQELHRIVKEIEKE